MKLPQRTVLQPDKYTAFTNRLGEEIFLIREIEGRRWTIIRRARLSEKKKAKERAQGGLKFVAWHDKRQEWGTCHPRYEWDDVCDMVDKLVELEGVWDPNISWEAWEKIQDEREKL